jgi:primosomal protein N'
MSALSSLSARFVVVVLERSIAGLDRELTYALPRSAANGWQIGQPVVVPLRTGRAVGYITDFTDKLDFRRLTSAPRSKRA